MHSIRMHTIRSSGLQGVGVSAWWAGVCSGACLIRGVSAQGGVCVVGGCLSVGVCPGVSAWVGVCLEVSARGCLSKGVLPRGMSARYPLPPPVNRMTDRHL